MKRMLGEGAELTGFGQGSPESSARATLSDKEGASPQVRRGAAMRATNRTGMGKGELLDGWPAVQGGARGGGRIVDHGGGLSAGECWPC